MSSNVTMSLEEILNTIVCKEPKPTYEAMERWVGRYPQYKTELVEFFVTWAEQTAIPHETAIDEERVSSRLVSHALNIVHRRTAPGLTAVVDGGATRLSKAIAQCGMSEAVFATRCNLDGRLVAKLDRRLIRPESIPDLLVRLVATALGLRDAVVRGMFAAEPIPLHSYKSKKQPGVKTEDFLDAVRASSLSPDSKAEWAHAVESEKKGAK